MKFTVTKEDIDKSRTLLLTGQMEECCPVALALRRQGYPKAIVCDPDFQLGGASSPPTRQPKSVQSFIHKHDNGKSFQPFSFQL